MMERHSEQLSVTIAMPIYGGINPWTVMSIANTVEACVRNGVRCEFVMEMGAHVISRDALMDDFLNKHSTQKLFWIDSDIVWEPGDFFRLLSLSTKRGVVCATYPQKTDDTGTRYQIDMNIDGADMDQYGLLPIRGAGLGFTVMDRSICEELCATKPLVQDGLNSREMRSVFRFDTIDGKRRSEDMAFFADIRDLGHQVWLCPDVNLGHVGSKEYTGNVMAAFTRKEAA